MVAKIALVLGILGLLLGLLITVVSTALPLVTDGRTSWEEAMLGIIPGILILVVSFFIAVIGLIFVIKGRKSE
jgi:hypothetical protein